MQKCFQHESCNVVATHFFCLTNTIKNVLCEISVKSGPWKKSFIKTIPVFELIRYEKKFFKGHFFRIMEFFYISKSLNVMYVIFLNWAFIVRAIFNHNWRPFVKVRWPFDKGFPCGMLTVLVNNIFKKSYRTFFYSIWNVRSLRTLLYIIL